MSERVRRAVVFLPVVVTLAVAGVVGALVIVADQRQSDRAAAADAVAQDYLSDVATFRASVVRAIGKETSTDPGHLRLVVARAVAEPPVLGSAASCGGARSDVCREAQRTAASLLQPYRRLERTLQRADTSLAFVAAARKVLALRASDYVGGGFVTSSARVRSSLVPAFVAARDTFARTPVPQGQEALAARVRGAVQYVIDRATALADDIDAGVSTSFSYSAQYQAASDEVDGYETTVKGDVAEAIDAVS